MCELSGGNFRYLMAVPRRNGSGADHNRGDSVETKVKAPTKEAGSFEVELMIWAWIWVDAVSNLVG
ncbi:hypothetical protein OROMI_002578 [Orobanche minor]